MDRMPPLLLECGVQHYDWGQRGPDAFIPRLLGRPAEPGTPYAELWIGAHPGMPSRAVLEGRSRSLVEVIDGAPEAVLGGASLERFGPRLPFLLKVLAAEKMLSLQAHPNPRQAAEGFAREEALGLPQDAPHRSYKDDSHKPELIAALTDFHALCGFRPMGALAEDVARHPEVAPVLADAGGAAATTESFYAAVLAVPDERLQDLLGRLVARLEDADRRAPFAADRHEHWILRGARQFSRAGRHDRGLLTMLMLELLHLAPGEGLFLKAGELHSYLVGVGVEIMASSDNVLRGGLTPKHVDAVELQRILAFRPGTSRPLVPDAAGTYATSAAEFELTAIRLTAGATWSCPEHAPGAEVLLVESGAVRLSAASRELDLVRGQAVLVPASAGPYGLAARGVGARVFRASVPRA